MYGVERLRQPVAHGGLDEGEQDRLRHRLALADLARLSIAVVIALDAREGVLADLLAGEGESRPGERAAGVVRQALARRALDVGPRLVVVADFGVVGTVPAASWRRIAAWNHARSRQAFVPRRP
jgi:hypothetical protein